jgi:hypothetical protein
LWSAHNQPTPVQEWHACVPAYPARCASRHDMPLVAQCVQNSLFCMSWPLREQLAGLQLAFPRRRHLIRRFRGDPRLSLAGEPVLDCGYGRRAPFCAPDLMKCLCPTLKHRSFLDRSGTQGDLCFTGRILSTLPDKPSTQNETQDIEHILESTTKFLAEPHDVFVFSKSPLA